MPELARPDGVSIHWAERGDGPTLLIAHNSTISTPENLGALLDDLAADHRVVTFDPRGCGRSSRTGPYDLVTDAGDTTALIEAVGPPVVAVSVGFNPMPLAVASARPDLLEAVVLVGALPRLGPPEGAEDVSLIESDSVVASMLEMMRSDPRALLRTMIQMGNTQLSDAEAAERLEAQLAYCPPDVAVARGESYLGHDGSAGGAALGESLWIAHYESPMSSAAASKRVAERLPAAHVIEVADGPISEPGLTSRVVRQAKRPGR